jgi:hypothetical protein
MIVPEEYIIQKFYQYSGLPVYNKFTNVYNGCCSICREGKSWGRKRRLFFLPKENVICCHNCGWYSDPIKWICEISSCSFHDIIREIKHGAFGSHFIENYLSKDKTDVNTSVPELPVDSINLFDPVQLEYYRNNKHIQAALSIITSRKLDIAINKPKSIWFTLKDKTHKHRLVIPFYSNNKIVHYQTRSIYDEQTPKYLSKQSSEKTLFNIDNIKSDVNTIFITEGPIDSFFIENGIATAGIQEKSKALFTKKQKAQISKYILHERIWVLDSQWLDGASLSKSKILCDLGERVFIWPKNIGVKYKDINDMCIDLGINRVPHQFLKENTTTSLQGKLRLSDIR